MANRSTSNLKKPQKGMSMIVVLMLLIITLTLGLGAAQIALMGERGSRNDRDYQIAWQAAESGLTDAEIEIRPGSTNPSSRKNLFNGNPMVFAVGCSNQPITKGLCQPSDEKPVWLTVDLAQKLIEATPSSEEESPPEATNSFASYGEFTGRKFDSGDSGLKPRQAPRYVIEILKDISPGLNAAEGSQETYIYRITSMGFGPREDIQVVNQSMYRP